MENSGVLFALAFISALVFISRSIICRKTHRKPKHPPGPKPWPIIGNLNLIGSLPHKSLHSLSQKYGQLMKLKFGKFPVVVASSPEMAKQFLRTHDDVFASRPLLAAGKYTSYNYSDLTWAPYGPYWRQARKIYMSEFFNPKKLESYAHVRVEEMRSFLSRLYSLSGKPVVIREHLTRFTLSTISRMVMGRLYFENSNGDSMNREELQQMLDEWFLLGGVSNVGDWIPWLNFLDSQGFVKRMKVLSKKLDRFYNYVIDDHQAPRDTDTSVPRDVLDSLLQLAKDPSLEIKLTKDCVKALAQNLLVGGTDTSATTVEWAVQEMVRHPQIYRKAKEELDRVIGQNRWVEEDDLSQLLYIDAIIKETFRLHPLTTLLAPHYAIENCNVAGYDILKGTMILINTWSIGRDANSWDSPEEFLPERFENKEIDVLGNNFAMLPFGSGRRRCPGYNLGLQVSRLMLANLLHGFNWKLPDNINPEDVSMEELYGLTTRPKVSLAIIMEPALPIHLY